MFISNEDRKKFTGYRLADIPKEIFAEASDWTYCWPVVDEVGVFTGEVFDSRSDDLDGYWFVDLDKSGKPLLGSTDEGCQAVVKKAGDILNRT